jgi:hypothetical protein
MRYCWLLLLTAASSCTDPSAEVPSYVYIEEFTLSTNASTEGSNSHKITDAWVYHNNELIGIFELPATFPVIGEGIQEVIIRAGIKINGIAASRDRYSFYYGDTMEVDLVRDEVTTIFPEVGYQSYTDFALIEGFEETSVTSFDTISDSDTSFHITTSPDEIYEGDGSMAIHLDNNRSYFICYTSQNFDLPQGGADVYVEMDYKTEALLYVGVFYSLSGTLYQYAPSLYINPNDEWNKIYIYLSEVVSSLTSAEEFKIYIAAYNSDSLSAASAFIDNFKLIH